MSGKESPDQSTSRMRRLRRQLVTIDRKIALGVAALLTFTGVATVPGTVVSEWTRARVFGPSRASVTAPSTPMSTSSTAASVTRSLSVVVPADARGSQLRPPVGAAPLPSWSDAVPSAGPPGTAHPSSPVQTGEPTEPSPTASPATASPTAAPPERTASQGFRVVEVFVRADPFNYTGTCPVTITFSGRISVAGGGGTVSFRFFRSDGASAPVQALKFDGPGSKDVRDTWTLGGAGERYSGWEAIQIYDPNDMRSGQATFAIQCR